MSFQRISEQLKWLAIEVELGRPNWPEILRAGIELIRDARPLAEGQYAERFARICVHCGGSLPPIIP